jgi:hypothetical protein
LRVSFFYILFIHLIYSIVFLGFLTFDLFKRFLIGGHRVVYSPPVAPDEECKLALILKATATNAKETADILSRANKDPQLVEYVVEYISGCRVIKLSTGGVARVYWSVFIAFS